MNRREYERIQGDGERETLQIPASVRAAVDERDLGFCRFCGKFEGGRRAHHHVRYGGDYSGMGGRRLHSVENIITVGYLFENDCHSIIHGNKGRWMPVAIEVMKHPGVTMLQLERWMRGR